MSILEQNKCKRTYKLQITIVVHLQVPILVSSVIQYTDETVIKYLATQKKWVTLAKAIELCT